MKVCGSMLVLTAGATLAPTFASAGVIGYYRMEAQVAAAGNGFNGIADSAVAPGEGALTGNAAVAAGVDDLIAFNQLGDVVTISSDVAPASMFQGGFDAGVGSYDASAIAAVNGGLFFPQDQYGDEYNTPSFTFEAFFKTNGDTSGSGVQTVVFNHEGHLNYTIGLNEAGPGAINFAGFDGGGFPSVSLDARNYADGEWHYVVASYDAGSNEMSLRVLNEDGSLDSTSAILTNDLDVGGAGNMFIGRNTFPVGADPRTFLGLIDEVRVSDMVLSDAELLGAVPEPASLALLSLGGLAAARRRRA